MRPSSARSSASRRATTAKLWNDSPIVRSTARCVSGSASAGTRAAASASRERGRIARTSTSAAASPSGASR